MFLLCVKIDFQDHQILHLHLIKIYNPNNIIFFNDFLYLVQLIPRIQFTNNYVSN